MQETPRVAIVSRTEVEGQTCIFMKTFDLYK